MPPRIPRGWAGAFHLQAVRGGSPLSYRPGWRGSGAQPMRRVPVGAYTGRASGIPLTGGQAQGTVPASGALTLSVGPRALGTVWYPTQVTLSTSTGALDASAALVYVGSAQVPSQLVASVYSGNGLVGQVPALMTPGESLIVAWSGAHPGDTAAVNITGTMDALVTGGGR